LDRKQMLHEFLEQNPADSFARYGLAMEHANSGDLESALAEFKKIVELNPDYTVAYQMAAQTLIKGGQNDEARGWLERGIACANRAGNAHARAEMEQLLDELSAG